MNPGWYDDPRAPGTERFHDGRAWTSHVRGDLPDIPPAPWVDPATVPVVVDSRPPRTTRAAAAAVGLGLLGIGALTWVGASSTLAALAHGGTEPVVTPTSRPGGEPVLPLYGCDDVADATLSLAREYEDLAITGWASPPVTEEDHQPILSLPPAGEQYLVISCSGEASFADGRTAEVGMLFSVDSEATIWADYAER